MKDSASHSVYTANLSGAEVRLRLSLQPCGSQLEDWFRLSLQPCGSQLEDWFRPPLQPCGSLGAKATDSFHVHTNQ
jgi:hypothetical protein